MPELYGLGIGALNFGSGLLNGAISRQENFKYNEKAAENADKRYRNLYNDLMSPSAQLQQLKDAGLSPAMYYAGNMAGQGGATAIQGSGVSGITNQTTQLDPLTMAQIKNLDAQTNKTNAETQNVKEQTNLTKLNENMQTMLNDIYGIEYDISDRFLIEEESGTKRSIFDLALNSVSYEDFRDKFYTKSKDSIWRTYKGNEFLRDIYLKSQQFNTELQKLNAEGIDASLVSSITSALLQTNYAELNADAAVKEIKTQIEQSELTASQKGAFNDLLKKLEETNPTLKDIVIIAYYLINNGLQNYNYKVGYNITKKTE